MVKPNTGGSSIGVSIVRERALLSSTVEAAFALEDELIVEEFVKGMELSAGVLCGGGDATALPLIEIVPKHGFYDYQHKYQKGWTDEIVPARISPELTQKVQALAVKAFHALKLDVYARVDFLLTSDGRAVCLEANTLPGMTPTSLLPQEAEKTGYGLRNALRNDRFLFSKEIRVSNETNPSARPARRLRRNLFIKEIRVSNETNPSARPARRLRRN